MRVVVINQKKPYDDYRKKARIVHFSGNKILVSITKGLYMLPGGKIEENENIIDALKREIEQETGNRLDETLLHELVNTETYASNYISRYYNKPITKCSSTYYYQYDGEIDLLKEKHLTESEKEGNFTLEYMDIMRLIHILKTKNETVKEKTYAKELLFVLREYLKQNRLIDLHTHTSYSDGEYEPDEVIQKAKQNYVSTIAITDHNTTEGLKHIHYEQHENMRIIPGIELSAAREHGKMHILGLAIDANNQQLLNYLESIKRESLDKILKIIDYLAIKGIYFNQNDLKLLQSHKGNVGRPELAKLLIRDGYVSSIKEAFDIYLTEAYENIKEALPSHSYEEILSIIRLAGGVSLLAHPNTLHLNQQEFEILLQDMIRKGLQGIETFHSKMSKEESKFYMEMVSKYGLLYSVGSDFHGEHIKPDINLGYGANNLYKHKASVLSYIDKRRHY